jgi:hypothetical protein
MKRLLLATLIVLTLPVFAETSAYENNLPTPPVPTGIYHHVTHIHHISPNERPIAEEGKINPKSLTNVDHPLAIHHQPKYHRQHPDSHS